jgi:hypothetical protein
LIPGATQVNYLVTANGTYTCINTNGDCVSEVSDEIVVTNVGLIEEEGQAEISLYPNPTKGMFDLAIDSQTLLNVKSIEVLNVLGQKLLDLNISEIQKVNLTSERPGVYFIQIKTNTGMITKRVVRN